MLYLKGINVNKTENIWHEYHLRLSAFIKSKVAEDRVDDLLQDVFIKIHTRISSLEEGIKLESWLYQITRNTIIDHYRSRKITTALPDWIEQPQVEEDDMIRRELSSCLAPMITALPKKYRHAIQMSEIENKTQKEVAKQEGISLSGAKSRVQRGRSLLKTMLSDCCQFEINKNNHVLSYDKKEKNCSQC